MTLSPLLQKKTPLDQGRGAHAPRGTTHVCREAAASHRDNGDESVRAYLCDPAAARGRHASPGQAPSARRLRSELRPRPHPPRFQPRRGSLSEGKGVTLSISANPRDILAHVPGNYNGFNEVFTWEDVAHRCDLPTYATCRPYRAACCQMTRSQIRFIRPSLLSVEILHQSIVTDAAGKQAVGLLKPGQHGLVPLSAIPWLQPDQ